MDKLRNATYLVGCSFLAGKAAYTLSGGLSTEGADYYCLLVKRLGIVKIMSLLAKAGSELGFSFGVRACTEMEIGVLN